MRSLVAGFLYPPDSSFLPAPIRFDAESLFLPQLDLEAVVEFLRSGFVVSPSRAAYSRAVWREEVDTPDITASV
jgi:hypothetical protein